MEWNQEYFSFLSQHNFTGKENPFVYNTDMLQLFYESHHQVLVYKPHHVATTKRRNFFINTVITWVRVYSWFHNVEHNGLSQTDIMKVNHIAPYFILCQTAIYREKLWSSQAVHDELELRQL